MPANMVVIRRELPRTRVAGKAMKASRIVSGEGSPLPCAFPAADPWCLYRVVHGYSPLTSGRPLERAPGRAGLRTLGRDADVPDEAQELSAYRSDDLLLRFALRQ
jgi:hypothetical protein